MSTHLEDRLTGVLADAADTAPVPGYDPVEAVRGRQRRRRNRHMVVAAACAVAVAAVGSVTAVRVTAPTVDHGVAADQIPDFANLAGPEKVWPGAVHRLPAKLPDGSEYAVAQVIDENRYLVVRSIRAAGPSVYDRRAGTVIDLATPAKLDGLADNFLHMTRVVGDRAVWFVDGWRDGQGRREAWVAPLDGGTPVRLESMADGAAPRFMVVGNAIAWEQEKPGSAGYPHGVIRMVSLDGGAPRDVPGTDDLTLTRVAPWATTQRLASGIVPKTSGELHDLATGARLRWTANDKIQLLRCGPTWCTGEGVEGVAIQNLDGTGYAELGYRGHLEQRMDGGLAVGTLDLPGGYRGLVWDRTTGRAAQYPTPQPEGGPVAAIEVRTPESDVPVVTWRPDDKTMMVLDLTAIR